jgi:hypothetical protein
MALSLCRGDHPALDAARAAVTNAGAKSTGRTHARNPAGKSDRKPSSSKVTRSVTMHTIMLDISSANNQAGLRVHILHSWDGDT